MQPASAVPHSIEARLRVRYAETDQMGVVYYANYLVWMELGRVEYCRAAGIRYRDIEVQDGVFLAVAESNCRYLAPARYDDEISVVTTVAGASPRLLRFDYVIQDVTTGKTLATGYTKHIWCGRDMRSTRLPEKYWSAFGMTPKAPAAEA
ncbi:MAG: thioesterase family protein [Bryobacteraceae bacterium]